MSLLGTTTPLQILQGRIRSLNSISVDRTLTIDGDSADAKAAGDGIREAKAQTQAHTQRTDNPHGVTRVQLGLGNVDNTADVDKPVSTAQAAAIAEARKAGTDGANAAQVAAGNAQTSADRAQTSADGAQAAAEAAQATADTAQAAAEAAQAAADSRTAWFTAAVTLVKTGWQGRSQTVTVPGVTAEERQPIFVTPAEESREAYMDFGIRATAQGADAITFSCAEVPEGDIGLNIVGFTLQKEDV